MIKIRTQWLLAVVLAVSCIAPAHAYEFTNIDDYLYVEEPKTISMDFKNAQLNDILKIFSQQSGLNFIASADVSGKTINLYLDNVPVEEALERILSANGLTYELNKSGNIFVVKEKLEVEDAFVTRIYHLEHATVPSSKLLTTFTDAASSTSTSAATSEEGDGIGVLSVIASLVGEGGSVIEEPRTNSLIVRTHPSNIPSIEQALARIDVRIPQILIEAEMLDISKNTADKLGALFGDTPYRFGGPTKSSYYPFDRDKVLGAYSGEIEYEAGIIDFSGLNVSLNFIKSQGDTKSLARPRILTLNNETAEIKIETDEAIGLTTTESSDTGTTNSDAERAETGVALRVTPQANLNTGEITMAVEPKVTEATQGLTVTTEFDSITFKDPEERKTQSILRVADGDTVIIGGLLRTEKIETVTKLPFLGDVPFVGSAFRHKNSSEDERELVIFLTPHILKETANKSVRQVKTAQHFVREQDVPSKRMDEISKELSLLEKRKF